jgi:hypothetical protein
MYFYSDFMGDRPRTHAISKWWSSGSVPGWARAVPEPCTAVSLPLLLTVSVGTAKERGRARAQGS